MNGIGTYALETKRQPELRSGIRRADNGNAAAYGKQKRHGKIRGDWLTVEKVNKKRPSDEFIKRLQCGKRENPHDGRRPPRQKNNGGGKYRIGEQAAHSLERVHALAHQYLDPFRFVHVNGTFEKNCLE